MPNYRLLLIEDDYDVAEMLLMYFSSHDYEVIHADNGTDGVDFARTRFPNLILLDVMLPDMDGYDVCVRLRQSSLTKYIPIIFLTQRDERANKVRGLELGADDYITKPFDIDELRLRAQGSIRRATRENLHEPRTGLPTGPLIEDELMRRRNSDESYTELVLCLSGFAEYTDVYGFMAGGDVLNHAGKTIKEIVSKMGTPDDFVGILNDDFVLLTHTPDVESLKKGIQEKFSEGVRAFYSFLDADRGGLLVNPGKEDEKLVPLMTIQSTAFARSDEHAGD
jgi:CheY-like chemotaxis protein